MESISRRAGVSAAAVWNIKLLLQAAKFILSQAFTGKLLKRRIDGNAPLFTWCIPDRPLPGPSLNNWGARWLVVNCGSLQERKRSDTASGVKFKPQDEKKNREIRWRRNVSSVLVRKDKLFVCVFASMCFWIAQIRLNKRWRQQTCGTSSKNGHKNEATVKCNWPLKCLLAATGCTPEPKDACWDIHWLFTFWLFNNRTRKCLGC